MKRIFQLPLDVLGCLVPEEADLVDVGILLPESLDDHLTEFEECGDAPQAHEFGEETATLFHALNLEPVGEL